MIKDAGMTQYSFYTQLKIKKPYFYDILSGKANPPPAEKQLAILEILHPDEETQKHFFEIAAKERGEVPADILKYFNEHEELRNAIRRAQIKKFTDADWRKMI
jgi:hypothetical protein